MSEQQSEFKFVNRQSVVAEIVGKYPDVVPILLSYGLHCVGCHVSAVDTIETGCATHGMSDDEINSLLKDINEFIEQNGLDVKWENKKKTKINNTQKNIEITQNAMTKIKELMKKEKKEGYGLSIRVVPGGCAGFSYELDFVKEPTKEETVIDKKELKIFIDKESLEMMDGAKIDYIDGLQGSGFKIQNPNAESSCGCGKSFR